MPEEASRERYAEIINTFFARFDAEDIDGLLMLFTPNAELHMPLYDKALQGHDELHEFFRGHMDNWKIHREWATSIIVDGERAASELHFEGVANNGAEIVMDNLNIYDFETGKIRCLRIYADTWDFKQKMAAQG